MLLPNLEHFVPLLSHSVSIHALLLFFSLSSFYLSFKRVLQLDPRQANNSSADEVLLSDDVQKKHPAIRVGDQVPWQLARVRFALFVE